MLLAPHAAAALTEDGPRPGRRDSGRWNVLWRPPLWLLAQTQVPVRHHPRARGKTKYGISNRLFRGLRDVFAVRWMQPPNRLANALLRVFLYHQPSARGG